MLSVVLHMDVGVSGVLTATAFAVLAPAARPVQDGIVLIKQTGQSAAVDRSANSKSLIGAVFSGESAS